MTLRDNLGDVDVGIGDLLAYKEAVLSVVCPEDHLQRIIIVRLHSGVLKWDLQTFDAAKSTAESRAGFPVQPLFRFTGELVAHCVRAYRLKPVEAIEAQPVKRPGGRPRKGKDQPNPGSLF